MLQKSLTSLHATLALSAACAKYSLKPQVRSAAHWYNFVQALAASPEHPALTIPSALQIVLATVR